MSAGIGLRSLGEGAVPIQEEHEARLERGIGISAWMEMDPMEKALLIATRRVRFAMDNLNAEAQVKQAEKNMRKRK